MNNNNNTPAFNAHIDAIKSAKINADKALALNTPDHDFANTSIACTWELLFSYLVNNPDDHSIENLKNLTAIIQKIAAAYTQLKKLELSTHDQFMKSEEHHYKIQNIMTTLQNASKQGLTPELIQQLEHQLNLI